MDPVLGEAVDWLVSQDLDPGSRVCTHSHAACRCVSFVLRFLLCKGPDFITCPEPCSSGTARPLGGAQDPGTRRTALWLTCMPPPHQCRVPHLSGISCWGPTCLDRCLLPVTILSGHLVPPTPCLSPRTAHPWQR